MLWGTEGGTMRLSLRHALAATTLLMLALGVAVANADPPSTNGKLSYTEVIDDTGSLVLSFDESSQKRFASVDYQVNATFTEFVTFDTGQETGVQGFPNPTVAGLVPSDDGHVLGNIELANTNGVPGCTCVVRVEVDYTNLTLTNLSSGHVYRLNDITRTYP